MKGWQRSWMMRPSRMALSRRALPSFAMLLRANSSAAPSPVDGPLRLRTRKTSPVLPVPRKPRRSKSRIETAPGRLAGSAAAASAAPLVALVLALAASQAASQASPAGLSALSDAPDAVRKLPPGSSDSEESVVARVLLLPASTSARPHTAPCSCELSAAPVVSCCCPPTRRQMRECAESVC